MPNILGLLMLRCRLGSPISVAVMGLDLKQNQDSPAGALHSPCNHAWKEQAA